MVTENGRLLMRERQLWIDGENHANQRESPLIGMVPRSQHYQVNELKNDYTSKGLSLGTTKTRLHASSSSLRFQLYSAPATGLRPKEPTSLTIVLCTLSEPQNNWFATPHEEKGILLLILSVLWIRHNKSKLFGLPAKWVWAKIKPPGDRRVVVHVSIYQDSILRNYMFLTHSQMAFRNIPLELTGQRLPKTDKTRAQLQIRSLVHPHEVPQLAELFGGGLRHVAEPRRPNQNAFW